MSACMAVRHLPTKISVPFKPEPLQVSCLRCRRRRQQRRRMLTTSLFFSYSSVQPLIFDNCLSCTWKVCLSLPQRTKQIEITRGPHAACQCTIHLSTHTSAHLPILIHSHYPRAYIPRSLPLPRNPRRVRPGYL